MEIRFEAAGPDREEELRSLFSWFADDRSLRGHVRLERVVSDDPGRMGPGLEAVLAVLSTATGLAQLPLSYLAWRQSRRPIPPVTINVVGANSAEAQDILRTLRGEAGPNGESSETPETRETGENGESRADSGPGGDGQ